TRSKRDWSSDVCSSDLLLRRGLEGEQRLALFRVELLRDLEDEPIARVAVTALAEVGHALALEFEDLAGLAAGRDPEFHRAVEHRSEERRVGKECRARWW